MDPTIFITFSGLYAILSGQPAGVPASADILLVDARKNAKLNFPAHIPVLTVAFEDVVPGSAAADATVVLPDGRAYFVWNLKGQTVSIVDGLAGSKTDGLRSIEGKRVSGSKEPGSGADEATDITWVAPIADTGVDAKPDPLIDEDPANAAVAAKIVLRRGTLSTQSLIAEKKEESSPTKTPVVFEFKKEGLSEQPAVFAQALAEVVRYAGAVGDTGVVTLELKPWNPKKKARRIQLKLRGDKVEVAVSNEPAVVHDMKGAAIAHFSAFYELLKKRPSVAARLLPVPEGHRTLGTGHCPPTAIRRGGS